jgi:hypothetical protein
MDMKPERLLDHGSGLDQLFGVTRDRAGETCIG